MPSALANPTDGKEMISSFLSVVDEMIQEGLVTAENFYATIAEFFPFAKDFCSLNISTFVASSAGNSSPTLT